MKSSPTRSFSIVIIVFVTSFLGCSSGNFPHDSLSGLSNNLDSTLDMASTEIKANRDVIGIWQAEIDPILRTFKIGTITRENAYHLQLSKFYPNVLSIEAYGWTPNFWADIKLSHPFPGSGIDAFDPRVIAVVPANPGVSSDFPEMDILVNDSILLRPDGYTKLWDNPSIPGNTNPFVAYFKNEPYRVWSSSGKTAETRRWRMNINGFGGPMVFQLVVDVSTNYPAPSQPEIDNAPEPVDIFVDIEPGLSNDLNEKRITAAVFSWRGMAGIGDVIASCPDLFDGIITLGYVGAGPAGTHLYQGVFQNAKLAPMGDYMMMLGAKASDRQLYLYKEHRVHVGGIPTSPSFVKQLDVSSTILHVDVDEHYAFFGDGSTLYIVDVLSPEEARFVRAITAQGYNLTVDNGYVYMTTGAKVNIYDADPLEFIRIVKQVDLTSSAWCQDIEGHYLYAVGADTHIIDISDISNASVIKWLDNFGSDVSVNDGYMYLANGQQLDILDVDPPETALFIKSISTFCPISGVHAVGNLCCISEMFSYPDPSYGLDVIDIDNPPAAAIIGSYSSSGSWDQNIYVSGNYAYIPEFYDLYVIDLRNPALPSLLSYVQTAEKCVDVCVKDNFAYLTCREHGLSVVKLW